MVGAIVQRKRCKTFILEQVPGNNLRKKLAVLGGSFGPEIAGGECWSPIVNKMLIRGKFGTNAGGNRRPRRPSWCNKKAINN